MQKEQSTFENTHQSTRYAVIGGAGFLGQHLIHLLLNQSESHCTLVRVVDKISVLNSSDMMYSEDFIDKRVQLLLNIDISKKEDLQNILKDIDVVFHLAAAIAYGRKNKFTLKKANLTGIENIIEQSKESFVKKIVYVSSFAALGCLDNQDKAKLASETCEKDWNKESYCYYGLSKYNGELFALNAANNGLTIAIAVPGVLLGPGPCHHASILPFEVALNKKWTVAPQGGSSYIDVRDVAEGLIALAKHTEVDGKYLLVSYNLEHRDLLQRISTLANRRLRITVIPRFFSPLIGAVFSLLEWFLPVRSPYSKEGIVQAFRYRYFSNQKAEQQFGWRPKYSLDETLQDAIDWLEKKRKL